MLRPGRRRGGAPLGAGAERGGGRRTSARPLAGCRSSGLWRRGREVGEGRRRRSGTSRQEVARECQRETRSVRASLGAEGRTPALKNGGSWPAWGAQGGSRRPGEDDARRSGGAGAEPGASGMGRPRRGRRAARRGGRPEPRREAVGRAKGRSTGVRGRGPGAAGAPCRGGGKSPAALENEVGARRRDSLLAALDGSEGTGRSEGKERYGAPERESEGRGFDRWRRTVGGTEGAGAGLR